jgi:N-methylhydantoinase A
MTLDPPPRAGDQEHVAEPLGLGLVEAADAIIQVANANMADAVG